MSDVEKIVNDITSNFGEYISQYCTRNSKIITRVKELSKLGIEIDTVGSPNSKGDCGIIFNLVTIDDFSNYNYGVKGLVLFDLLLPRSEFLTKLGDLTFKTFHSLSESKMGGSYGDGDYSRHNVTLEIRDYFKVIEILRLEHYKIIKKKDSSNEQ